MKSVRAPVRRPVERWADDPGVEAPVVDFEDLDAHASAFRADQLFVCLGTTLKKAGSREAFRRVDHDYVLACARLAAREGARDLFLVSSTGADSSSRIFYSRVKGEAEEAVSSLPFRSVYVFRPSVLTGQREEVRFGERLGIALGSLLAPLMVGPLRRYRPVAAASVAGAMAAASRSPEPGRHVVESEAIEALAGGPGAPKA